MITLADLRRALQLPNFDPTGAHQLMSPPMRRPAPPNGIEPRQAGVLVVIYPDADDWHIILTRRNENLRGHSGQISFPGGRRDPQDESFTATALRETCEELGLCEPAITIVGMLSPIYIPPSNFEVYPTVAALPASPALNPNPHEVAEVFTLPLTTLLDPKAKAVEEWNFQNVQVAIPFYAVRGHKVWGATAIMLSEFEDRLRAALAQRPEPMP